MAEHDHVPPSIERFALLHDATDLPDSAKVDAAARRIMAVHAHPDDEASKGAGTIRMLADDGVRATLVTCTGGEEGDILNPAMRHLDGAPDLGDHRMAELADAAEICGYAAVYLLGYRDSGMADSDANAHPAAFANAALDDATARLVALIRAERPQVLLGYDEHEHYPHPDHVAAHKITMAAFDAAADADWRPELGAAWQVAKLYWFNWSIERMRIVHTEFERRGWESPFAQFIDRLPAEIGDGVVTTRITVGDYLRTGRAALVAHKTQVDPDGFWLKIPDDDMIELWPYEDYRLVRDLTGRTSAPSPDALEDDVFAGIDI